MSTKVCLSRFFSFCLEYIDISKKDVNQNERQLALKRYQRAKTVHSCLQHVCLDKKMKDLTSMSELYQKVVWPLHKKFKNDALRAFYKWYK